MLLVKPKLRSKLNHHETSIGYLGHSLINLLATHTDLAINPRTISQKKAYPI